LSVCWDLGGDEAVDGQLSDFRTLWRHPLHLVLQCVADSVLQSVCCSQCVAVSVLQSVCCSQCVAVCCSVLHSVLQSVCCSKCVTVSVLQCVAVSCIWWPTLRFPHTLQLYSIHLALHCVAVSALQSVCCNVSQSERFSECVAVSVLQ